MARQTQSGPVGDVAASTPPGANRPAGHGDVLLCTDTLAAEHGRRIAAVAPGLEIVTLGGSGPLDAVDRERVTMVFFSKDAFPHRAEALFESARSAPALRWFHTMSAGVDGAVFDELRARGVIVTRSAGASAPAMAETVFLYLHALARGLDGLTHDRATRTWRRVEWRQLEGRRILVLGYGPVGKRIVELALAYRMLPTVVRRTVRGDEPCAARAMDDLIEVAADCDILAVAVPLTDETAGLVSSAVLAAMPRGALLVNVARGAIVDQQAVVEALADGRLAGAGLDVFDREPLEDASPLWHLPNVIVTPHNSGQSIESAARVVDIFLELLAEHVTDPEALRSSAL